MRAQQTARGEVAVGWDTLHSIMFSLAPPSGNYIFFFFITAALWSLLDLQS